MRITEQIDIFGTRDDGIIELDINGWVTPDTIPSINLAIKSFDYKARGMIFDYRGAVIALRQEDVKLFTYMPECPVAHLITPMHDEFTKAFVTNLRGYGYKRIRAYSREEAEEWLFDAIK